MNERNIEIKAEVDGGTFTGSKVILRKGKYSYQTIRYAHLVESDTHEYKSDEWMLMSGMAEVILSSLVRRAEGIGED